MFGNNNLDICDFASAGVFDVPDLESIKEVRKFIQANLDTIHAFADLSVKAAKRSYPMLPDQTKYIIFLMGKIRDITKLLQPCDISEKKEEPI